MNFVLAPPQFLYLISYAMFKRSNDTIVIQHVKTILNGTFCIFQRCNLKLGPPSF